MTYRSPSIKFRKLPASFNVIAVPLLLSVLMSCIVSGISTWTSLGFAPHFIRTWMEAWAVSWAIAFPTLLVVLPLVRRTVAMLVEPGQPAGGSGNAKAA